jgi:aminopeptidase-like protein
MTRAGVLPYWHQVADTFDKMNPEVMERSWEMTRAMIDRLED